MKKTPRRVDASEVAPQLTRLEAFVLSRVDGQLSVGDLVSLTGLAQPQVEQILKKLEQRGAIEVLEDPSVPQLDDLLKDEPPYARTLEGAEATQQLVPIPPDSWVNAELPPAADTSRELDDSQLDLASEDDAATVVGLPPLEEAPAESEASLAEEEGGEPTAPHAALVPAEGDATDPEEAFLADAQGYRKRYESVFGALTVDERVSLARTAEGHDLLALCFDQDPRVVSAILENDRASLDHARLVATHHRNPVGLAKLCERVSILSDGRVQRLLLRNGQLTELLARKILMPKRLAEIYRTSLDRDIPDRTRTGAKAIFRAKYAQSAAEEKFEVIWTSEGRVLPLLLGQPIDQKTASLFCARPFTSIMLIQSFARFPGTPPGILSHMLKQPVVKRQAHLRNAILQHPNVPSDAKRRS